MEIFMHNLPLHLQEDEVKLVLAAYLHGPNFDNVKTNFVVHLHKPKQRARARTGTFTVADASIGTRFLQRYGSAFSSQIIIGMKKVFFEPSRNHPRREDVEFISRMPWINPVGAAEKRRQFEILSSSSVAIDSIQFGWQCRDGVFSIESEASVPAQLSFEPERREIRVSVNEGSNCYIIAIRQSSINSVSTHSSRSDGRPVIFLDLDIPPSFFLRENLDNSEAKLKRTSTFPLLDNLRALPFVSLALRLVLSTRDGLRIFSELADTAKLRNIESHDVPVEPRSRFSKTLLEQLERDLRRLNWSVAYQVAVLLQNCSLDAREILDLMPRVRRIVEERGKRYAASLLKEFAIKAANMWYSEEEEFESIMACFESIEKEFSKQGVIVPPVPTDGSLYQSLHVTITPTTMILSGPYPEQSNRVIRRYHPDNHESFLRVTFRDENSLQYRFDRGVDGLDFLQRRVGPFLKDGLKIAGRNFQFLAYSQSALKDHSVWFVKPFNDPTEGYVDAATIIQSLGSFQDLAYDPDLIRCPARYAARLSQAFTATDAAVVSVEEIMHNDDIKTPDGKYNFTDGVGTLSRDLAREIWVKIRSMKKKKGKLPDFPRAYQIRYMGSKGMLSVDYRLEGSTAMCLRPSMIKFDAPRGDSIEIARAFNKPTPYYLNRPLIALLEGLGVPFEVFKHFQEKAVKETEEATTTLNKAAHLLETHGLGASFRLPSTMLAIAKLGLDNIYEDRFYSQMLKVAVYHVLRDLRNHARIPVPDAWTLVGVADIHAYLEEGQIFACIKQQDKEAFFLEGPVLVSRSPTIHPGDVQLAHAIGIPPEGSCFAKEPLHNTVVFSVKGKRPLPSYLGGGDLDGDIYNLIPLKDHPWFTPNQLFSPAEYAPAEKKLLDRPSTMDDVADFVLEYIVSDVVGIIAMNWLIIADQSPDGIVDEDCLKLAQLHSNAVDYPKSGRAVELEQIPRLHFKAKPDWNAPETVNPDSSAYYQSQKTIGKLFRAIDLQELTLQPGRYRRRGPRRRRGDSLANNLASLNMDSENIVSELVERRVARFLDTEGPWDQGSIEYVATLFKSFKTQLMGIAHTYSISHRNRMLSEEEIIVGTITQKTSQPTQRKESMTKMREQTEVLVRGLRQELEGDDTKTLEDYLKHAWLAWERSLIETRNEEVFGARSFGWIALSAIFDAMKQIEEHDAAELRSNRSRRG